jgi:DNA-binding CsgD family transcriptional regulator
MVLCSHCQQPMSIARAVSQLAHLVWQDRQLNGVNMSQQSVQQTDQTLTLLSYLASKPTLDDVAQFLVLDVFQEYKPRAALISVFDSTGDVSAAGSFGLPADIVRALRHMSLWDKSPAVDVIRDGKPLAFATRESLVYQYPWLEKHEGLLNPTIVWPLTLGTQRLGSLHVQFAEPVEQAEAAPVFIATAPILGLYLNLRSTPPTSTEPERINSMARSGNGQVETELSARQLRILHLLAEGLTNPQIAARIGFSDSTVRQETMAIYRFLGANGRREAVHIAGLRGLLNEQQPTSSMQGVERQSALTGHSQHPSVWSPTNEASFG